jgi:hypothetical protein
VPTLLSSKSSSFNSSLNSPLTAFNFSGLCGQLPRRLRDPDRQKVVYAAAAPVVVMPRWWKRVCMVMRRVS